MTLLSPERPADLSPAPESATSLTQLAGGSTVPAGPEREAPAPPGDLLRALGDRLVLLATVLWLAARVAGLALGRLIDWFAEEPRRTRAAVGGLAVSVLVGAGVGTGIGLVLAGCWGIVRGLVLDDLG